MINIEYKFSYILQKYVFKLAEKTRHDLSMEEGEIKPSLALRSTPEVALRAGCKKHLPMTRHLTYCSKRKPRMPPLLQRGAIEFPQLLAIWFRGC
jgi:hypothetical protein